MADFRLALIVEGNEEVNFLRIVNDYGRIKKGLSIEVINAEGVGNIPSLFDAYYGTGPTKRPFSTIPIPSSSSFPPSPTK